MEFPRDRLIACDELFLHGLVVEIKSLGKPLSAKKYWRTYYHWVAGSRPISISDIKKYYGSGVASSLIKKALFVSVVGSQHKIPIIEHINKEIAYLCGYHLGDGCISKDGYIIYYMDTKEQLEKISKIYLTNFGIGLKIKKSPTKDAFSGVITSKALSFILGHSLELGFGKKGCLKYPSWLSEDLKFHFMAGFLAAEFGVKKKDFEFSGSSIDKNFLIQLQKDLSSYGLVLKMYGPYKTKKDPNPRWFLKTSRKENISFLRTSGLISHHKSLAALERHAPVV